MKKSLATGLMTWLFMTTVSGPAALAQEMDLPLEKAPTSADNQTSPTESTPKVSSSDIVSVQPPVHHEQRARSKPAPRPVAALVVPHLNIGDEVISARGWRGTVALLSENEVSVYYYSVALGLNGNYSEQDRDLARTHGRANGLSVGDTVISGDGWQGTVAGIFPDGTVSVYYYSMALGLDGYYRKSPQDLGRTHGSVGGLKVGEDVISRRGWKGTITAIFPDQTVSVYYSSIALGLEGNYRQSLQDLARTHGQMHGLTIGEAVVDTRQGWQGTVSGFFPDGTVSVYYYSIGLGLDGYYLESPSNLNH